METDAGLSPEEASELDHYLRLEHVMRLDKARALGRLNDEIPRTRSFCFRVTSAEGGGCRRGFNRSFATPRG